MDAWGNLVHQITMLCLDPESGVVHRRSHLTLAAAGGALAELAIQERVSLVGQEVEVHDRRPTEDRLLDVMLDVLASQSDRRPARIIETAREKYLNRALDELVSKGWVLYEEPSGFRRERYHMIHLERLQRARELAIQGFHDPNGAPMRAVCLAGLAHELQISKELVPEMGWWQRNAAAGVIRKRDWVVRAVSYVRAMRAGAAA